MIKLFQFLVVTIIQLHFQVNLFYFNLNISLQNNYSQIENGKVYGWGNNEYSQLELGHNENINEPTLISSLSSIDVIPFETMCYFIGEWNISNHF